MNLTAVIWKILKQILLEHISGHISKKNVMGNIISMDLPCISHAPSLLTPLVPFCDKITRFVG